MIIWRGWGFLTVLIFAAIMGLTAGLFQLDDNSKTSTMTMSVAAAVAGTAIALLGYWLNQIRPHAKLDPWLEQRRQQLFHLVETGQFNPQPPPQAPGTPPPPPIDPWTAASDQLEREAKQVRSKLFNVHTLFFIPMHYLGYVTIAGALFFGIKALFTS